MASILPPVDRSITVSAPRSIGHLELGQLVVDVGGHGRIADIRVDLAASLAIPMPIGSRPCLRCSRLAGITIRPRATSSRTSVGLDLFSGRATYSISGRDDPSASLFDLGHGANDLRQRAMRRFRSRRLPSGDGRGPIAIVVGPTRSGQFGELGRPRRSMSMSYARFRLESWTPDRRQSYRDDPEPSPGFLATSRRSDLAHPRSFSSMTAPLRDSAQRPSDASRGAGCSSCPIALGLAAAWWFTEPLTDHPVPIPPRRPVEVVAPKAGRRPGRLARRTASKGTRPRSSCWPRSRSVGRQARPDRLAIRRPFAKTETDRRQAWRPSRLWR